MSELEKEAGYLTQKASEAGNSLSGRNFSKTMQTSLGGSASKRRPEIEHIINPGMRNTQNDQNWILDNMSVFTS